MWRISVKPFISIPLPSPQRRTIFSAKEAGTDESVERADQD